MPCGDGGRYGVTLPQAKECQGLPVTPGAKRKHGTYYLLEASEMAQPCRHLDFRLPEL